jgi:hypothetical protein
MPLPDVIVRNHGNQFTCTLVTKAAQDWVKENVEIEGWAWMGNAVFSVDQHYIEDLVAGMEEANLLVKPGVSHFG